MKTMLEDSDFLSLFESKEKAEEELVAVSSLIASGLDKDMILELNDLDDIQNGNVHRMRERLRSLIVDGANWSDSITFELSAYDQSQCNYVIADYPQTEEVYLNTYFLQTVDDLNSVRVGDSNTYQAHTFSQADYYIDAITVIYDGNRPIAAEK